MVAANRRAAARRLALRTGLLATASLIALTLAGASPARAQTVWNGAVSNDWFVAGNWTAGVPVAGSGARIYSGSAAIASPGAVASSVSVGDGSIATLTIRDGGTVSTGSAGIASSTDSTGTVTVDGAGSNLTTSAAVAIGLRGTGTLAIRNGGTYISSVNVNVGQESSSTGIVTVDGVGSTWTNSGSLHLGYGGTSTLTIENGGAVSTASIRVGYISGSSGTLTIRNGGTMSVNGGL